jgi:hypothetical protein
MRYSLFCFAGAVALGTFAVRSHADTLLYSFETLYDDAGVPNQGTRPDGYHFNGGDTTVTQDTFGATVGLNSMKFQQGPGATFTGAQTEVGLPFTTINDPGTTAIRMDVTVKAGEEFTGNFANLGLTEFGEDAGANEGQLQTVVAGEQPVVFEPGTYTIVMPLIARFRPFDPFEANIPFSTAVHTGANPLTPTSFQIYVNKPAVATPLTIYIDNVQAVTTQVSALNAFADGNWSDAANWLGLTAAVPNGVDATAVLGLGSSGDRTITVDAPQTLGTLLFNTGATINVNGSSAITLDVSTGQANIQSYTGSHTVSAPLTLNDNTTITVSPTAAALTLTGELSATGRTVTKAGNGRVEFVNVRAAGLAINAGTVRMLPGGTDASTSKVNTLTIAGGTTPTARLDITNNAVVVDYGPVAGPEAEPLDTIKAQITAAFAGGAWTGNGITSADANTNNFAVGYAERSALAALPAIFNSVTVDSTSVLIRLTRYGDADLSGTVNSDDFNRLASSFGTNGKVWSEGNFNYDALGTVNSDDFNLLAGNFGLSATAGGPTPEDWANLAAAVPEPGSMTLLLGAGLFAGRRRRIAR